MDAFESASQAFEQSQSGNQSESASPESKATNSSQSTQDNSSVRHADQSQTTKEAAIAIAELDKMDKFKLDGQEWTLKDLKAAILRQKDYTTKTQALAQERDSFGKQKEYYEKLAWDLMTLKQNPNLASEFIKVYPQEFHKYAEQVLGSTQEQTNSTQTAQQAGPQVDVQTLSRLDRLEKFYQDQEIKKNEQVIEQTMAKLSEKYPDASNFKELVLARAFEAHNQGVQLTEESWEDIFKQVNSQVGTVLKAKYGDMVKKQTEANSKAKDVASGGGTAGRAPQKFKSFDEVTKLAMEEAQRA